MYDFACSCGRGASDLLVPSHSTVVRCTVCGNVMTRMPAAPAFALKGAGFYANDSKQVAPRPQPHQTKEGVYMRPVSPERAFRQ